MIAVLAAAGLGTRLLPITENIPKCLVPIGGRPLLDFWIANLLDAGITQIFINTHSHSDLVTQFVSKHPARDFITLFFETKLLGTAGTLKKLAPKFRDNCILFAHADNFCLADLNKFIDAFKARPREIPILMMTFRTDQPRSCGIVELNEDQFAVRFHEKVANPPSNLANAAVFSFDQRVTKTLMHLDEGEDDFSLHVVPKFLGQMLTWENETYHRDIGTLQSYEKCLADWNALKNDKWR